jgi:hypothetical protein
VRSNSAKYHFTPFSMFHDAITAKNKITLVSRMSGIENPSTATA